MYTVSMKLPSATEMGLLVALGSQRLTGRQLAKSYAEETGATISYGSLYTTMSRLREAGWVDQADSEDEDGRLRYFRITGKGARAVDEARVFYCRLLGLEGSAV
jgi:DNA-binding PadR family transcriptional regulator